LVVVNGKILNAYPYIFKLFCKILHLLKMTEFSLIHLLKIGNNNYAEWGRGEGVGEVTSWLVEFKREIRDGS
jgi:hypothetical protein